MNFVRVPACNVPHQNALHALLHIFSIVDRVSLTVLSSQTKLTGFHLHLLRIPVFNALISVLSVIRMNVLCVDLTIIFIMEHVFKTALKTIIQLIIAVGNAR